MFHCKIDWARRKTGSRPRFKIFLIVTMVNVSVPYKRRVNSRHFLSRLFRFYDWIIRSFILIDNYTKEYIDVFFIFHVPINLEWRLELWRQIWIKSTRDQLFFFFLQFITDNSGRPVWTLLPHCRRRLSKQKNKKLHSFMGMCRQVSYCTSLHRDLT